jgi:hypothetical protein
LSRTRSIGTIAVTTTASVTITSSSVKPAQPAAQAAGLTVQQWAERRVAAARPDGRR